MIPRGVEIFAAERCRPKNTNSAPQRALRPSFSATTPLKRSKPQRRSIGSNPTKILFFDGTGLCVFYKRLDKGTFRIPEPAIEGDAARMMDERALDDLLEGVDIEPARARRRSVH